MEFDADIRKLGAMLAYICQQFADRDPEDVQRLELACEEALTNIIHHAYGGDGGKIAITCRPPVVEIRDWGKPFDPLVAPDIDPEEGMEARQVGGLGVYLLKKLVSTVDYSREGEVNLLLLSL